VEKAIFKLYLLIEIVLDNSYVYEINNNKETFS